MELEQKAEAFVADEYEIGAQGLQSSWKVREENPRKEPQRERLPSDPWLTPARGTTPGSPGENTAGRLKMLSRDFCSCLALGKTDFLVQISPSWSGLVNISGSSLRFWEAVT